MHKHFFYLVCFLSNKILFRGVGVRTVLMFGVLSSDHNALLAIAGNHPKFNNELMSQFRLTYLVTVRPNLIKNTDTLGVIGGNTAQWLA